MTATEQPTRGSVLVVDDEPTIAEVVSRYLVRAGYDTRVAGDGPRAIELAGERRPDLVVLDLMLPGLDGLEVMRRLRELGETGPRERLPGGDRLALAARGQLALGIRLGLVRDGLPVPQEPELLVVGHAPQRTPAAIRERRPARSDFSKGGSAAR